MLDTCYQKGVQRVVLGMPGALRLRVSRLVLAAHDARRRYPRSSLRLARYQDGCDGHPPLCTRALGISAYQQTVSVACP